MARGGERRQIGDMAEQIGVLDDDAAGLRPDQRGQPVEVVERRQVGRAGDDLIVGEARQRLEHRDVMRVHARRDQRLLAPRHPARHEHRLGHRGRAVVHRRVGDIHAGEARHLRLEFEQILQRALRDLGLVGGVAGQELAALDEVVDRGRDMVLVGAAAEEERPGAGGHVARREAAEMPLDRLLGHVRRQPRDRAGEPRRLGHVGEQRLDVGDADGSQHGTAVGGGVREIAHQVSPCCSSPSRGEARDARSAARVGVVGQVPESIRCFADHPHPPREDARVASPLKGEEDGRMIGSPSSSPWRGEVERRAARAARVGVVRDASQSIRCLPDHPHPPRQAPRVASPLTGEEKRSAFTPSPPRSAAAHSRRSSCPPPPPAPGGAARECPR